MRKTVLKSLFFARTALICGLLLSNSWTAVGQELPEFGEAVAPSEPDLELLLLGDSDESDQLVQERVSSILDQIFRMDRDLSRSTEEALSGELNPEERDRTAGHYQRSALQFKVQIESLLGNNDLRFQTREVRQSVRGLVTGFSILFMKSVRLRALLQLGSNISALQEESRISMPRETLTWLFFPAVQNRFLGSHVPTAESTLVVPKMEIVRWVLESEAEQRSQSSSEMPNALLDFAKCRTQLNLLGELAKLDGISSRWNLTGFLESQESGRMMNKRSACIGLEFRDLIEVDRGLIQTQSRDEIRRRSELLVRLPLVYDLLPREAAIFEAIQTMPVLLSNRAEINRELLAETVLSVESVRYTLEAQEAAERTFLARQSDLMRAWNQILFSPEFSDFSQEQFGFRVGPLTRQELKDSEALNFSYFFYEELLSYPWPLNEETLAFDLRELLILSKAKYLRAVSLIQVMRAQNSNEITPQAQLAAFEAVHNWLRLQDGAGSAFSALLSDVVSAMMSHREANQGALPFDLASIHSQQVMAAVAVHAEKMHSHMKAEGTLESLPFEPEAFFQVFASYFTGQEETYSFVQQVEAGGIQSLQEFSAKKTETLKALGDYENFLKSNGGAIPTACQFPTHTTQGFFKGIVNSVVTGAQGWWNRRLESIRFRDGTDATRERLSGDYCLLKLYAQMRGFIGPVERSGDFQNAEDIRRAALMLTEDGEWVQGFVTRYKQWLEMGYAAQFPFLMYEVEGQKIYEIIAKLNGSPSAQQDAIEKAVLESAKQSAHWMARYGEVDRLEGFGVLLYDTQYFESMFQRRGVVQRQFEQLSSRGRPVFERTILQNREDQFRLRMLDLIAVIKAQAAAATGAKRILKEERFQVANSIFLIGLAGWAVRPSWGLYHHLIHPARDAFQVVFRGSFGIYMYQGVEALAFNIPELNQKNRDNDTQAITALGQIDTSSVFDSYQLNQSFVGLAATRLRQNYEASLLRVQYDQRWTEQVGDAARGAVFVAVPLGIMGYSQLRAVFAHHRTTAKARAFQRRYEQSRSGGVNAQTQLKVDNELAKLSRTAARRFSWDLRWYANDLRTITPPGRAVPTHFKPNHLIELYKEARSLAVARGETVRVQLIDEAMIRILSNVQNRLLPYAQPVSKGSTEMNSGVLLEAYGRVYFGLRGANKADLSILLQSLVRKLEQISRGVL